MILVKLFSKLLANEQRSIKRMDGHHLISRYVEAPESVICAYRQNLIVWWERITDVANVRYVRFCEICETCKICFGEIWKEKELDDVAAPYGNNAAAGLHVVAGCHDDNDDGLHGDNDEEEEDDEDDDEDEDDEEKSDGRLVRKIHLAVSRGPADKLHPVINYTR